MGWVVLGAVVVLFGAVWYRAYAYDWDQIQERSRRHQQTGRRPQDAPDWMPGHGGGSAGG